MSTAKVVAYSTCDSVLALGNKKAGLPSCEKPALTTLNPNGRGEKIRTSDPLHPMQVRYQAALRPDRTAIIARAS
jgi:hypothetical protein